MYEQSRLKNTIVNVSPLNAEAKYLTMKITPKYIKTIINR